MNEQIYQQLGKLTEELFLSVDRYQKDDYQRQVNEYLSVLEEPFHTVFEAYQKVRKGKVLKAQYRKLRIFRNDYDVLHKEIDSKLKLFIQGRGKAGKSTLLNALLAIDKSQGSRLDMKPMTFTIDTFTDELSENEAILKYIDEYGITKEQKASKEQAREIADKERADFEASKKKCQKILTQRLKAVYSEQERQDIEKEVYEHNLLKTKIREIKWGIGRNDFLQNCLLIDTPGLDQELRFTNVIEDVKNYEADGIIWVISSDGFQEPKVINEYKKAMIEFKELYDNNKFMAVINMRDEELTKSSKQWGKIERAAKQLFGKDFQDIVCVNNKMAYEGFLSHNEVFIEESNIKELKSKINQRFIEKNSDESIRWKISKIRSFVVGFYKEVEQCYNDIYKILDKYKQITSLVTSQSDSCKEALDREQAKSRDNYLSAVKNRIEANSNQVREMDTYELSKKQFFLHHTILNGNTFEQRMLALQKRAREDAYSAFGKLQKQCIISDYQTVEYAYKDFINYQMQDTALIHKSEVDVEGIIYKTEKISDSIDRIIDNLLDKIQGGKNDDFWGSLAQSAKNISKGIYNRYNPPEKRLGEAVAGWAKDISDSYSIAEDIQSYKESCLRIRDQSMEGYCAAIDSANSILEVLEQERNQKQEWQLEKVTLQNILWGEKEA